MKIERIGLIVGITCNLLFCIYYGIPDLKERTQLMSPLVIYVSAYFGLCVCLFVSAVGKQFATGAIIAFTYFFIAFLAFQFVGIASYWFR